ncbi:hypothetical protein GN316_17175 [Xylophilus sp. Kf1]|nr:hypothetical protein [Xylophilus sp. Kf1]
MASTSADSKIIDTRASGPLSAHSLFGFSAGYEEEVAPEPSEPFSPLSPPLPDGLKIVRMLKGADIILSPLLDVSYFEAQGKYTRVVLREQEGLLQMGLSAVEAKLPTQQFMKIHRSLIVNIAKMQRIKRDEFGRMALFVVGRTEALVISRPYERLFRVGIY